MYGYVWLHDWLLSRHYVWPLRRRVSPAKPMDFPSLSVIASISAYGLQYSCLRLMKFEIWNLGTQPITSPTTWNASFWVTTSWIFCMFSIIQQVPFQPKISRHAETHSLWARKISNIGKTVPSVWGLVRTVQVPWSWWTSAVGSSDPWIWRESTLYGTHFLRLRIQIVEASLGTLWKFMAFWHQSLCPQTLV